MVALYLSIAIGGRFENPYNIYAKMWNNNQDAK